MYNWISLCYNAFEIFPNQQRKTHRFLSKNSVPYSVTIFEWKFEMKISQKSNLCLIYVRLNGCLRSHKRGVANYHCWHCMTKDGRIVGWWLLHCQLQTLIRIILSPHLKIKPPSFNIKAGFQVDAFTPASDWLRTVRRWLDWLKSPSSEHQNLNSSKKKME